MRSIDAIVRGVLAHRSGFDVSTIRSSHHLDRDLDLTPLELVLVALEMEDIQGLELPIAGLASVETVGDLCWFVSNAVASERHARALLRVA